MATAIDLLPSMLYKIFQINRIISSKKGRKKMTYFITNIKEFEFDIAPFSYETEVEISDA